jgi:hypothetical protein
VSLTDLFCLFANRHQRRGGGSRSGPTGRFPSGSHFYCSRRHIGTYMQASCVFQSRDDSFKGPTLLILLLLVSLYLWSLQSCLVHGVLPRPPKSQTSREEKTAKSAVRSNRLALPDCPRSDGAQIRFHSTTGRIELKQQPTPVVQVDVEKLELGFCFSQKIPLFLAHTKPRRLMDGLNVAN